MGESRTMPVFELTDGARMPYADDGAGAPILLVHGWAAHGGFFADLSTRLARSHRVLTPTLRGHVGSTPGTAELTIETIGHDLASFVDTLGLKSVIALGWSMGAMALWSAAETLGPRLEALIIEDMAPRLANDPAWPHGLNGGYGAQDIAATLNEIHTDWPAYVARFAPRMFAPAISAARPELVAWAIEEMSAANAQAMAALWSSMAAQDFREAIARVAQPTLVINGGESQVYPDGATAFVAETTPRGERRVIAGAGHVPHLEAPEEFYRHVEAFVRVVRRPELRSGGALS
jgi:pimeloyl-ACP methyl ester carboxylesterase